MHVQQDLDFRDEQMCEAMGASLSTIGRVRQKFVEEGGDAALSRRKGSGMRELKIDGECEAHVVALILTHGTRGASALDITAARRNNGGIGVHREHQL